MEPWVQAVAIVCGTLIAVGILAQFEKRWKVERQDLLRRTILYQRWERLLLQQDTTTVILEIRDECNAAELKGLVPVDEAPQNTERRDHAR